MMGDVDKLKVKRLLAHLKEKGNRARFAEP